MQASKVGRPERGGREMDTGDTQRSVDDMQDWLCRRQIKGSRLGAGVQLNSTNYTPHILFISPLLA